MSHYPQNQYYSQRNSYEEQAYQTALQNYSNFDTLNDTSPHKPASAKGTSQNLPYPLNQEEIDKIERERRNQPQQRSKSTNVSSPAKQPKTVTSPPKLVTKQSENSVYSNTSTIYSKDLAYFEYFGHTYNQVINDTTSNAHFSPYVQLRWAITLFVFSFHLPFIQYYNINCVELHRPLNDKELHHNSRIILEHAMKVLNRLCSLIKTGKKDYDQGYPMALYFMGQLYSQRLDFDFLLGFFDNDPIGSQQCNMNKVEYNDLLKNLQASLSKNKILPLNDFNAFKYYEKCYLALHAEQEDSSSDWILCGVSNLFRLSVCLEYGKGCDADEYRSLKLFYEGWKDWKDPVSGYKLACIILKEEENYELLDKLTVQLKQSDLIAMSVKILRELDTPQSNFEMGKYYEKLFNKKEYRQYDPVSMGKLILKNYVRSFELNYNLASWKLGQIYEFGYFNQKVDMYKSLNFYYKDTKFPLNCLSISGWLLTGNKDAGFLPNDKESFIWLVQAYKCTNGDRYNKILYGLGIYYQFGIGCQADLEKCEQFMLKAAKLGHSNAQTWLNENSRS